ncbi:PaaI family thioesterase [Bradyrhizobium sp. USDA 4486]
MSETQGFDLQILNAVNASAAFNRSVGFDVVAAGHGEVTIRMGWRDDLTQYSGHLHAALIAALLDTACGFAAATLVGAVTASHFSMNCLRPAIGRYFVAKGTTLRAGRAGRCSPAPSSSRPTSKMISPSSRPAKPCSSPPANRARLTGAEPWR